MAAITGSKGASVTATLATTLRRLEDAAGNPLTGDVLVVTWPSASQSPSNLVRARYGSGSDGGAVATNDDTISPGTAYEARRIITGIGEVYVAGSSAFACTFRVI